MNEKTRGKNKVNNKNNHMQGKEILELQDELTGALIGLARSCGNNPKTENTDELLIEGLTATITNRSISADSLNAMIEKVRKEKNTVAPDCAICAAPCGNTSEYSVSNIWKHEAEVRSVETALLFGIREMATIVYPAVLLGHKDEAVIEFFYKVLCMISYDMKKEDLLAVVMELGEMNLKCRKLLESV